MNRSATQLLVDWSKGDRNAAEELIPLVYDELRRLAVSHLRRERGNHTLQSTALVHEAFLRMINQQNIEWQSRAHFFGIASRVMRRILVDHARARNTAKRGAGATLLELTGEVASGAAVPSVDLIALDTALDKLATVDRRQMEIIEMRFFGGLTIEETAECMSLAPVTVKREWSMARAWLFRELAAPGELGPAPA